ncbi:hypothetical protein LEN26_000001 [Aphanomyces euteiches]|nr:hypothetical protein LEN26_000001 [Aphanomyces euteiches]
MREEIRQPTVSASCTRWSLVYNLLFALNLVTTPFMAYLTEHRPGAVFKPPPLWNSFDEYVNVTTTFLREIYNNDIMDVSTISRRDIASNSFGMRHAMTILSDISEDDGFDYLVQMPFSCYYGHGMRTFVRAFLMSNESSRNRTTSWQLCQHQLLLGMTFADFCLWFQHVDSNHYTAWGACIVTESTLSSWIKFIFRWMLSGCVFYLIWTFRYEVVVGDPVYAILSVPWVSIAMIADIFWSSGTAFLALMQVTQFRDAWLYISGCLYLSRYVWFAYLGMRVFSSLVKWREWEPHFAPVDPGFLAICAYLYCGPILSVLGRTRAVWLFHQMWSLLVPDLMRDQAVEIISASLLVSVLFACIPSVYSRLARLQQLRKTRHGVRPSVRQLKAGPKFSDHTYNDMKAYILLMFALQKHARISSGGTLHKLYQAHSRYRKLPLLSHRSADCFVLCYNVDGSLAQQVRMSLLSFMDPQLFDPKHAIPTRSTVHAACDCVINNVGCETFMAKGDQYKCIHRGETKCQWVI